MMENNERLKVDDCAKWQRYHTVFFSIIVYFHNYSLKTPFIVSLSVYHSSCSQEKKQQKLSIKKVLFPSSGSRAEMISWLIENYDVNFPSKQSQTLPFSF